MGVPNFIFGQGGSKKRGPGGGPPYVNSQLRTTERTLPSKRCDKPGLILAFHPSPSRPDNYTCKICDQKGHWIQECPEKEARDAARDAERVARGEPVGMRANAGAREPIRPIQREHNHLGSGE